MNLENRREEKHIMASPQSVIVTYYEGDINTVVDEHYFCALSKNSTPKDLSIKHKEEGQTPHHPDSLTPPSRATSQSRRSVCSPNHTSHMAPCFSAEEPVRSSSVIVSRPETPASWILPQKYTLTLSAHPPSTAPSSHPQERGVWGRLKTARSYTGVDMTTPTYYHTPNTTLPPAMTFPLLEHGECGAEGQ